MSSISAYRDALRDQLAAGLALSLDILRGDAEPDPAVLLPSLEAAAALAARDECPEEGRRLLALAPTAPATAAAAALLDLSEAALDLDGPAEELHERLDQLAALAAVHPLLPPAPRDAVGRVLARNLSLARLRPEALAHLSSHAGFLADALDLPDDHPASVLLDAVSECALLARVPIPAGAQARALARLDAHLDARDALAGGSLASEADRAWLDWARRHSANLAGWLGERLAEPVALAADTSGPVALHARCRLAEGDGWELNLLRRGGELLLEWAEEVGEAPVGARLEGVALPAVPSPVATWWVLRHPPADDAVLELTWADGRTRRVPLGG